MEHENYLRISGLLRRAKQQLEEELKRRWRASNETQWSQESAVRFFNSETAGQAIAKGLNPMQRKLIVGSLKDWDITLLARVLRSSPFKLPKTDALISDIASVRNTVAHKVSLHVPDSEFNQLWRKLELALLTLGGRSLSEDVEALRYGPVEDAVKVDANTEHAEHLNESGNALLSRHLYVEAARKFSEAIQLFGISRAMLAKLYSNRSLCHLQAFRKTKEHQLVDNALSDAIKCQELLPKWYKAHVRVGEVYMAWDRPNDAELCFSEAHRLKPLDSSVRSLLNKARRLVIVGRNPPPKLYTKRPVLPIPGQQETEKGLEFYSGSKEVPQDIEQAYVFFKKGVALGNAEAMFNLAILLMDDKQDFAAAHDQLLNAARQNPKYDGTDYSRVGVAEAENTIGLNYQVGVHVDKDFLQAQEWYERAVQHGSAHAANNLALMLLNGEGGNERFEKIEELLHFSYRNGEIAAASNLTSLYIRAKSPRNAQIWRDRAIAHGVSSHEMSRAVRDLNEWASGIDEETLNAISENQKSSVPKASVHSDLQIPMDIRILAAIAERFGGYAKTLCESARACQMGTLLFRYHKLATIRVEEVVDFYHRAFTIEPSGIACRLSPEIRAQVYQVVRNFICGNGQRKSSTDNKARLVLACNMMITNGMDDSIHFLSESIEKYPQDPQLYSLRSNCRGFNGEYELGLKDVTQGLLLDPSNCDMKYDKAVFLRNLCQKAGRTQSAFREAYREFLAVAPKNHRKVPECYYAIGVSYLPKLGKAKQFYEKGLAAERHQLPFFQPYSQGACKGLLRGLFEISRSPPQDLSSVLQSLGGNNDASKEIRLDPYRVDVIRKLRDIHKGLDKPASRGSSRICVSRAAQYRQTGGSLVGLKEIFLNELDVAKDHVATGYVLTATIIEPAAFLVGVHFVIADNNGDVQPFVIYNLPGSFPSNVKQYSVGTEVSIISPYLRRCGDGTIAIRVDDPSTVVLTGKSKSLCRYCGKENAMKTCGRCKSALYCDRVCQEMDWKKLQHKDVCRKITR